MSEAQDLTPPAPSSSLLVDRPLQGVILLCLGTVFLAGSDAAAKYLNALASPLDVAWMRYAVYAAIVTAAIQRKGIGALRTQRLGLQVVRGLCALASAICFITSVKYLPLADATAVTFVAPTFVTLLSVFLLKEVVRWHRWSALVIGFAGVLIIVRPSYDGFDIAYLWPIAAALFWAVVTVTTRQAVGVESALTTFSWSAFVGFIAITAIWISSGPAMPAPAAIVVGVIVGLLATGGQWLVVLSSRCAETSLLAPFTYTQLFWSCVLGLYMFETMPDLWAMVGIVTIAASGLYMTHREQLRKRSVR